MQIELYSTASEPNRVIKTLSNKKVVNGSFKNGVNLISPVMKLTKTNITAYNYCYIPQLQRYYFIEKVEIDSTGVYTVYLNIDVLMTYADDIKSLQVTLSASKSNPYYSQYINGVDVRTDYYTKQFENNFNETGDIILVGIYGTERG